MQEHVGKKRWYLLLLVALQLAIGLPYLDRIPRVFVDEAWDAALACNIAERGRLCHPFVECLGGMEIHYLPNRLVMPFISAGIFKISDCTILSSRAGSQLFAVLAVIALYSLTCRWFGPGQAFLIVVATIINPWFFEASRRARPEIYYIALSLLFLLILVRYFDTGSRYSAFLAGLIAGLLALTHANGIFLAASIGLCALIWLRNRPVMPLLTWGAIATSLMILPYLIYLVWATRHPEVELWSQFQGCLTRFNPLKRELRRWLYFMMLPKLLPSGIIMCISWFASWYRSSKNDKLVATILVGFSFLLLLGGLNGASIYLSATVPFWAILIVRLWWRLAIAPSFWVEYTKTRFGMSLVVSLSYVLVGIFHVSEMFHQLYKADFKQILTKVSETVKPEARIFADPIFWFGREKFDYGPYPVFFEGRQLGDCIKWCQKYKFAYAIRTSWTIEPPRWAEKPKRKMPNFREGFLCDHLCQLFGTKIDEFNDPYYGPIEIYELDLSKRYFWLRTQPLQSNEQFANEPKCDNQRLL